MHMCTQGAGCAASPPPERRRRWTLRTSTLPRHDCRHRWRRRRRWTRHRPHLCEGCARKRSRSCSSENPKRGLPDTRAAARSPHPGCDCAREGRHHFPRCPATPPATWPWIMKARQKMPLQQALANNLGPETPSCGVPANEESGSICSAACDTSGHAELTFATGLQVHK